MQQQVNSLRTKLQKIIHANNAAQTRNDSRTESEEQSIPKQSQPVQSSFGLLNFKNQIEKKLKI